MIAPMSTAILTAESFLENQFPVSKVSKESYKERKAVSGQTLTGLGKWWGRKPLVLVRAGLLGLLMPPSDDPKKDREVFLKLMTMDDEGLLRRRSKDIRYADLFTMLTPEEQERYFDTRKVEEGTALHHCVRGDSREEQVEVKAEMQALAFGRLSYDERLNYCDRPEEIDGPSPEAWAEINGHLGTSAQSLPELARELGERRFGRVPRVGDAFCGGGSVPFEAARLGFEAYGSDLNPVAALLTWGALNLVGGGEGAAKRVAEAQRKVYEAVDRQITEWGIEHNEKGWRADAFLYCVETDCPECGYNIPLAPSWVIATKTNVVAVPVVNEAECRVELDVKENASKTEVKEASQGTVQGGDLVCPNCRQASSISSIRRDRRGGENGLRLWEASDIVPREQDILRERLYCVRWQEERTVKGRTKTFRHYTPPGAAELKREQRVLDLLMERFEEWQTAGYIPSLPMTPGGKIDEPIRTRGWTHWHHLFNPRQLLVNGLFALEASQADWAGAGPLLTNRIVNLNSRICRWLQSQGGGIGGGKETFDNQAFNTLYNYSTRSYPTLESCAIDFPTTETQDSNVSVVDARSLGAECDVWMTDPPYADAINYHELSEFFLAWDAKQIADLFPEWATDSRRALAVVGQGEGFRRSMVDCYRNLAAHMPDEGVQVVMFTHQDAGVWADLALILWAAGLRVTAAWTIATETDSALKTGNYVQGTVLLVLRKRTSTDKAFPDELVYEIEDEVKRQLDTMKALDEDETDPNFADTDYQLAAYAAALRVLTQYGQIEGLNIERELSRSRMSGEASPIAVLIEQAVKIAADHLIPKGFDSFVWKTLTPEERLYLKGLELEAHGEYRNGAYQELARGFGVREYTHLYASGSANETRFMNATEFGRKELGKTAFGTSLLRNALFAVREARAAEDAAVGRNWLRNEMPDYWSQRRALIEVLSYFERMGHTSDAWRDDAEAAGFVAGSVANDHA